MDVTRPISFFIQLSSEHAVYELNHRERLLPGTEIESRNQKDGNTGHQSRSDLPGRVSGQ